MCLGLRFFFSAGSVLEPEPAKRFCLSALLRLPSERPALSWKDGTSWTRIDANAEGDARSLAADVWNIGDNGGASATTSVGGSIVELFSFARLIFIANLEGFCSDVGETGEPCRGTTSSLGTMFVFDGSVRLYNDW